VVPPCLRPPQRQRCARLCRGSPKNGVCTNGHGQRWPRPHKPKVVPRCLVSESVLTGPTPRTLAPRTVPTRREALNTPQAMHGLPARMHVIRWSKNCSHKPSSHDDTRRYTAGYSSHHELTSAGQHARNKNEPFPPQQESVPVQSNGPCANDGHRPKAAAARRAVRERSNTGKHKNTATQNATTQAAAARRAECACS
jgi:hypothetical protein